MRSTGICEVTGEQANSKQKQHMLWLWPVKQDTGGRWLPPVVAPAPPRPTRQGRESFCCTVCRGFFSFQSSASCAVSSRSALGRHRHHHILTLYLEFLCPCMKQSKYDANEAAAAAPLLERYGLSSSDAPMLSASVARLPHGPALLFVRDIGLVGYWQ